MYIHVNDTTLTTSNSVIRSGTRINYIVVGGGASAVVRCCDSGLFNNENYGLPVINRITVHACTLNLTLTLSLHVTYLAVLPL